MPCYHPLRGWPSNTVNKSGKRSIVFRREEGQGFEINVPCGQCIGCRLERSRQWAIRCVHEASLYQDNCFITLTYHDEHLPEHGSLVKKDFQDFMKRLRKKYGSGIRFFHCGEYGDKLSRPHYHACLFNFDFPDKELLKVVQGNRLFTSSSLQDLWPFGFSTIGDVSFDSAAYVARYVVKKVNGEKAKDHYERVCLSTGELVSIQPEYITMSRRPGIGKGWFEKYQEETYRDDFIVLNGKKMRPPKFYDGQFEIIDPVSLEKIKSARKNKAKLHKENNTLRRLQDRETVQDSRSKLLIRKFEESV